MKARNLLFLMLLVSFGFIFSSCTEDDDLRNDRISSEEIDAISDDSYSEGAIDEAGNYVDDAFEYAPENGGKTMADSARYCATVSHDTVTNLIVLDFGTAGCVGVDGKTRAGKIEISYTGKFARDFRGSRTVTFKSYAVEGNTLLGSINYSQVTANESEKSRTSTVTVSNLVLNFADGTNYSLENRQKTRKVYLEDRKVEIYGTSNGTNRFGKTFSTTVASSTPLLFGNGCSIVGNPHPVAGIKVIERQDRPTITVDFGDGECDRKAVVSNGTNSKEITLRR